MTATVVLSASGDSARPSGQPDRLCTDGQTADFVADTSLAIEDAVAEQARPDSDDAIERSQNNSQTNGEKPVQIAAYSACSCDENRYYRGAGMIGTINHIAIAVPDLAAAADQWRARVGAEVFAPQALPEHGVTVVFIKVENGKIELLEPLDELSDC